MKKFNFKIRGNKYDVEIGEAKKNMIKIEVNGTEYNVELDHEINAIKTPVLKRAPVKTHKKLESKTATGSFKVLSPLPGNIMQLFVKNGDEVAKGDKLLIYEAMKMENTLLAERAGKISGLKVQPGDAVLQDVELMEII